MYKSRKKIMKNDLINDFLEIFPQIKKDFFLEMSLSNAEKKICNILENLKKLNLLKVDSNSEISWSDNEKDKDAAEMFASLWLESLSAN